MALAGGAGGGAVKTPRGGGADTLFLSWLLAFRFAIEGFEVSSRSRVWVNSDHET